MSRYKIHVPDSNRFEAYVGWDNPLQTFFAQVYDLGELEEEDAMAFWVGGVPEEITTIEALEEKLREYTVIPQEVKDKLRKDFEARTEPTPLQRLGARMFREALNEDEGS